MDAISLPLIAFGAGILSFTSPCCIPLVPGYLSFISGLPVSELGVREARGLTLRAAVAFVAGFTVVFTVLGASIGLVGSLVIRNLPLLLRVSGVAIIVLGLAMAGVLRVPWLARERRFDLARVAGGPRGAFPLGMAFGFGWVPCIGPVLATILTIAAAGETVAWGAVLLAVYSVGLGLPFVLLALGFQHGRGTLTWLRTHSHQLEILGGVMLVIVGILFVTGLWQRIFVPLQRTFSRLNWPPV